MKKIFLTALMGFAALTASAQMLPKAKTQEPKFDREHTIDYLVVYDKSNPGGFIESRGGREAYAQEVVDSINSVLRNTGLDYRFRVCGVHYLNNYQAPGIVEGHDEVGRNEEVNELRQKTKADIVVLLTETLGDINSGLADHRDEAIHTDAFSCVNLRMAASSYTAAHEAGHILGGYHARGSQENQPSSHEWAAGYYVNDYRTVICSAVPGVTVPVYSGPDVFWNGVRMGDETHNNKRMVAFNLARAVHFGDHLDPNLYYASDDELIFDKHAQKGQVSFYGNQFMSVTQNGEWIKNCNNLFGSVQIDPSFDLEANNTGKIREGSLTVTGDANHTQTIRILQSPADVVINSNGGSYNSKVDNFVDKVHFFRNFDDTQWQTLCVPFIWRNTDWKELFEVARLERIECTGDNEATLHITVLTTEDLEAHKPYLVRAKAAKPMDTILEHVNLFAASTARPVEFATDNGLTFTVNSTYSGLSGQDFYNNYYYTMTEGQLCPSKDVNLKLGSFRWYLSLPSAPAFENNPRPSFTFKISDGKGGNEGGDNTGIEDHSATTDAYEFYDVYDLNGRLLYHGAQQPHDLQPGVYIINGEKVYVK